MKPAEKEDPEAALAREAVAFERDLVGVARGVAREIDAVPHDRFLPAHETELARSIDRVMCVCDHEIGA